MKKLLLLILLGSCSSFTPITVHDRIEICESGLGGEKECAYVNIKGIWRKVCKNNGK